MKTLDPTKSSLLISALMEGKIKSNSSSSSSSFVVFNFRFLCMITHNDDRWVEHDPMEILESVRICVSKTIDKATANGYNIDNGLKAIGITNQRETTAVWRNPPEFLFTMQSSGWIYEPAPFAGSFSSSLPKYFFYNSDPWITIVKNHPFLKPDLIFY